MESSRPVIHVVTIIIRRSVTRVVRALTKPSNEIERVFAATAAYFARRVALMFLGSSWLKTLLEGGGEAPA